MLVWSRSTDTVSLTQDGHAAEEPYPRDGYGPRAVASLGQATLSLGEIREGSRSGLLSSTPVREGCLDEATMPAREVWLEG